MQKNDFSGRLSFDNFRKALRTMKLMTFLLLIGVLSSFSANSYSQGALISIGLEKHSIKEVLGTIERKSDYAFFFSEEISNELERKVNVHAKQTPLDRIRSSSTQVCIKNPNSEIFAMLLVVGLIFTISSNRFFKDRRR